MTTADLVRALAKRLGVSQKQARTLLDGYVGAITRQLAQKNSVILRNFGSFSVKDIAEKRAYVQAKNSLCLIPAHPKLHFKPPQRLKEQSIETLPPA